MTKRRKKDKLPKLQTEEALRRAEDTLKSLPDKYKMWGGPKGQEQRVWNHLVYYLNADLPADTLGYLNLLQILNELTRRNPFLHFMLKGCGSVTLFELTRFQAVDFVSV